MALIPLILMFYEAVGDVCSVSYQETNETLFDRAVWMATSVSGINKQLHICCKELKKGVITEPFSGDIWKVQSQHRHPMNSDLKKTLLKMGDTALDSLGTDFYFHNSKILYFKDFVPVIEDGIAQMNHLLDDAQEMISNLNPDAYGNYYHRKKSEFDEKPVRTSYHQWKLNEGPITFEKLKVKQIETLANAIKTGIMKHDTKPVHKENLSVNMDLFIQNLPDDYEYPDPFVKCCAKLRRYVSWNDDILQIHYNDFGRYFCRSMHKFSLEQLAAIYELDMMLSLIHQDMVKLRPELAESLNATSFNQVASEQQEVGEEMFHFVHPSLDDEEGWKIHKEVKRLVKRQSLPDICQYLRRLASENRILLPLMPSVAYAELTRMGMPSSEGFSEKYFRNCYLK